MQHYPFALRASILAAPHNRKQRRSGEKWIPVKKK